MNSKYLPYLDDSGDVDEDIAHYCNRVGELLPNFNKEILAQWFYEHPDSAYRYDWLDYEKIEVSLETIRAEELLRECYFSEPFVEYYRALLQDSKPDDRLNSILNYANMYRTWPIYPIVLLNRKGTMNYPGSVGCATPYLLIEGRHRFAVLQYLYGIEKVASTHKLWVFKTTGS
ncbi:hypothetical protein [Shewanella sp.]|uniref:hypothetical protein n=1 Tax=Shewanella sp. TaxID=50422 RepID=UPI003A97665B